MPYDPSPIRRDSVITQAAQEICRLIEAERLGPGDVLPPETRLADTAAAPGGKGMFDESVIIEAAPIANDVRSHIAQKCAELAAARLSTVELTNMEGALASLEAAIERRDMNAAKGAHDAFHGLFL